MKSGSLFEKLLGALVIFTCILGTLPVQAFEVSESIEAVETVEEIIEPTEDAVAEEVVQPELPITEEVIEESVALEEAETVEVVEPNEEKIEKENEALENVESLIVKYEDEETIEVVEVGSDESVLEVIETLEDDPDVEYVEPNYSREIFFDTNDTFAGTQWSLDKIKLGDAWNIASSSEVVVAVIDTGVDYTHPDLDENMWDGTTCKSETGDILWECVHGYDFRDNDVDPMHSTSPSSSTRYHGTHVAGIIAAEVNNGEGIAGVAPHAKIMALRFAFDVATEVRAIDFARENGAKIINASYGGADFSQAEYDAIKRFTDAGGIFIAAAGNSGRNSDESGHTYPSDYDLPGIISVAATDDQDLLASFSNYGNTSVDLAAPGKNIVSLTTGHSYVSSNGTSMAAPHVAGAAALLLGYRESLTSVQIKDVLMNTGDPVNDLSGKVVSGKRLNMFSALSSFNPRIGYESDDSLVGGIATTSSSMNVEVRFRLKNGVNNVQTTLHSFEYSEDGSAWLAPEGGDESLALSSDWEGPYGSVTSYAGSTHSFTIDSSLLPLTLATTTEATSTAFYIRFKSHDGAQDSPWATSEVINLRVTPLPVVEEVVAAPSSGGGGGGGGGGGSKKARSRGGGGGGGGSSRSSVARPNTIASRPSEPVAKVVSQPTPIVSTAPVSTQSPSVFNRSLALGSSGSDVSSLQSRLRDEGVYAGPITGYFGPLTSAAVSQFQLKYGLPEVGSVDMGTIARLNTGLVIPIEPLPIQSPAVVPPQTMLASVAANQSVIDALKAEIQRLVLELQNLHSR